MRPLAVSSTRAIELLEGAKHRFHEEAAPIQVPLEEERIGKRDAIVGAHLHIRSIAPQRLGAIVRKVPFENMLVFRVGLERKYFRFVVAFAVFPILEGALRDESRLATEDGTLVAGPRSTGSLYQRPVWVTTGRTRCCRVG